MPESNRRQNATVIRYDPIEQLATGDFDRRRPVGVCKKRRHHVAVHRRMLPNIHVLRTVIRS
jgi:hypothetical protein